MSVLSRPTRHHITAPTQREAQVPLPRTSPDSEKTTITRPSQVTQPAPQSRRTRVTMIVGGGLAVALAVGVGTYALIDDGGTSTVIAPAVIDVPAARDLGPGSTTTDAAAVSEAQRQAALAQRRHHMREDALAGTAAAPKPAPQAPAVAPGSAGDAAQTEAERAAALAQRTQNIPQ